jgi:ElaA protein
MIIADGISGIMIVNGINEINERKEKKKMQLGIKQFHELTTKELYEILRVRAEVFVVEQNCVYQDLDEKDMESLHLFYKEKERVHAYLRVFRKEKEEGVVQIGRVLTTMETRGTGLGLEILKQGLMSAKDHFGAEEVYIEAQCYAIGFYERVGFQVTSEEFLEDGIPHVEMRVSL